VTSASLFRIFIAYRKDGQPGSAKPMPKPKAVKELEREVEEIDAKVAALIEQIIALRVRRGSIVQELARRLSIEEYIDIHDCLHCRHSLCMSIACNSAV
jgi:hypothetical protein